MAWDGAKVKDLLTRSGMSVTELAFRLTVDVQTVRNWLAGRTRPLPITAKALDELERQALAKAGR